MLAVVSKHFLYDSVAQLVEQRPFKAEVLGSIPSRITKRDPQQMSTLLTNVLETTPIQQGNVLDPNLFEAPFADLTITSPPYNVGITYNSSKDEDSYTDYLSFSRKWLTNVFMWTKETGRLCMNIPLDKNKGGQQAVGADLTQIAKEVGWKYHSTIVWNEQNISRRTAWGSWLSASAPYVIAPVELIVVMYKDKWKKSQSGKSDIRREEFIEWTNGLWTFNGESKKRAQHPAPFPEKLPLRCIKLFSYLGDTIFDPFVGSGTTVVVAKVLNRKAVGVDIDKSYVNIAEDRLRKKTASLV